MKTYTCSRCKGNGGSDCFINTGLDSSKHENKWVDCEYCEGSGEIDMNQINRFDTAKCLAKRMAVADHSIREMAVFLGVSPSEASKLRAGSPKVSIKKIEDACDKYDKLLFSKY